MPASRIRTFSEPDKYAAAMRQATVEFTVTDCGAFQATLCCMELHNLWMQRFSANLGWTSYVNYWGGHATLAFQTVLGPSMIRNGRECPLTSVVRLSTDQSSYYLRSPGANSYATISLPLVEFASCLNLAVGNRDPAPADDCLVIAPRPSALAKLRWLHEAAGHLAQDAPAVLTHSEVSRNLEWALISAMMDCLSGNTVHDEKSAHRRHAEIMRRFHQVIEERAEEPVYLPELCREVGASERTLRHCCQEHLGMAPKLDFSH